MAASSRGRAELSKQWKEREMSPDRANDQRKVAVVYYLCRNGHLEHPHFMEVSLSSPEGLYLRDVINRLNVLRGRVMARMYSWSSKRSYKNGFVWHDLSQDDFIHPVHGHEYVLKGTELLHIDSGLSRLQESAPPTASSSASSEKPPAIHESVRDINEYKIHKSELPAAETVARKAANASTQTDGRRQRRRALGGGAEELREMPDYPQSENFTTELSREEITPPPPPPPPPLSSSTETLEELMKADAQRRRRVVAARPDDKNPAIGGCSSGRIKASAMLMHLFSCGSIAVKEHGLCLASQYRARVAFAARKELDEELESIPSFRKATTMEKEYFSGSLVETKKMGSQDDVGELLGLRRSSSFNADRDELGGLKMDVAGELEGARAKCMLGKPRMKEVFLHQEAISIGSKRMENY